MKRWVEKVACIACNQKRTKFNQFSRKRQRVQVVFLKTIVILKHGVKENLHQSKALSKRCTVHNSIRSSSISFSKDCSCLVLLWCLFTAASSSELDTVRSCDSEECIGSFVSCRINVELDSTSVRAFDSSSTPVLGEINEIEWDDVLSVGSAEVPVNFRKARTRKWSDDSKSSP